MLYRVESRRRARSLETLAPLPCYSPSAHNHNRMASPLESLPFELLETICCYTGPTESEVLREDVLISTKCTCFPYSSLARLVRTSKSLQFHVEPILYNWRAALTVALYRAIREGNVDTIRKAVSYGASPNVLEVYGSLLDEVLYGENRSWRVHSLHIALKFRQPAAFQVLVKLGADVNHPALWRIPEDVDASSDEVSGKDLSDGGHACEKFVRRLCRPRNAKLLRLLLLKAATEPKNESGLRSKSLAIQRISLISIIGWAGCDLVQLLLDKQADPNGLHPRLGHRFLSPLSAAILTHSPEAFKLLISHGANINGKDVARDRQPMHIPVFAAATQMLQGVSGLAMMQLCLDHGANINRPCHEHNFPISVKARAVMPYADPIPHVCTTALFTFLGSIKSWQPSASMMCPVDGLKFLLNAGASAVSPPSRPIQRRYNNTQLFLHDRTYAGASSTVELLLDKWGLGHLNEPEFFKVLELLIRHGAARPFFARILVKYDSVKNPEWADPEIVSNWQRLLDLLITDLKQSDTNIDVVLRRVIADKGYLRSTLVHSPWRGVGEIGRTSINALIAAGADINARIQVPLREATASQRDTALQEVCSAFIHTDQLENDLHDHLDGHLCEYSLKSERTYSEWFAFLISKGADPYMEDTHPCRNGESAIDIMLSPMKEGRASRDGRGSLEKHLMRLIAVLKGTTEPLVYDGARERYAFEDLDWLFTRPSKKTAIGKGCVAR